MKGRKPKPTALRLIEGNREHRPINHDEPKPERNAPPRPSVLTGKDERQAWRYLVQELGKMGTLASSDQGQMAAYAYHWGQWVKAKRKLAELSGEDGNEDVEVIKTVSGNYAVNPWVSIANRALKELVKVGAELGLNPIQRTRIKLDKPVSKSLREMLTGGHEKTG